MAVKLRLKKMGAKKGAPFYSIVVADTRSHETDVRSKRSVLIIR